MANFFMKKPDTKFIYGIRPIQEALENNIVFDKVWVAEGQLSPTIKDILFSLRKQGTIWKQVPFSRLGEMVRGNHQGIVATVSAVEFSRAEDVVTQVFEQGEDPFIVILDGVTDVRNFGAITRSAACAGAHAVVIPAKGSAAVNADAVKTSAGALLSMPICKSTNLYNTIKMLKSMGLQISGCSEKASDSLYKTRLEGPRVLVMGGEEKGMSTEVWKLCDNLFKIPMNAKGPSSLNVSVAAGIALFEIQRQRENNV